jgi:hypothetical protein
MYLGESPLVPRYVRAKHSGPSESRSGRADDPISAFRRANIARKALAHPVQIFNGREDMMETQMKTQAGLHHRAS